MLAEAEKLKSTTPVMVPAARYIASDVRATRSQARLGQGRRTGNDSRDARELHLLACCWRGASSECPPEGNSDIWDSGEVFGGDLHIFAGS